MKLENQVVSLELAKELKELGVPQESLFYWYDIGGMWKIGNSEEASNNGKDYSNSTAIGYGIKMISAFTVAELGEMLPNEIESEKEESYFVNISRGFKNEWEVDYRNSKFAVHIHHAETLADALAKMLIYLLKNKLITL